MGKKKEDGYCEKGMVIFMKDKSIVEKTITYIENHLNEDLSLDELAKNMHYSKFYLERAFAETIDCTVYQYIKRRRLTEAARELVETDKPIVEIALGARYNSQQAFTLAFRQLYLCSPKSYRQQGIFSPKQDRIGMRQSLPESMELSAKASYGVYSPLLLLSYSMPKGGAAA